MFFKIDVQKKKEENHHHHNHHHHHHHKFHLHHLHHHHHKFHKKTSVLESLFNIVVSLFNIVIGLKAVTGFSLEFFFYITPLMAASDCPMQR